MRNLLLFLIFTGLASAQCSQTTAYPSSVAADANLGIAVNNISTRLTSSLTIGTTSVPVASATGIVANMILSIDYEAMCVVSIATNTLTVVRGYDGTTAAIHTTASPVQGRITARYHNSVKNEIEAIENALGANLANVLGGTTGAVSPTTYNWSQTPSGSISAGASTVTLTPCPTGLAGADANHWVYISGPSSTTLTVSSVTIGTPITVTTTAPHGLQFGNFVTISGGLNNLAMGPWAVTVTGASTFTLNNSTYGTSFGLIAATNTAPIEITTNDLTGLATGDTVTISGVTGNTNANGTFTVTRLSDNRYTLDGSTGNGSGLLTGTMTIASSSVHPGGTVTFGPEAAIITGGTCTSGATTGTITFTAKNAHAAGYTIASASGGIDEAIRVAQSISKNAVALPAGTITTRAPVTVPTNFTISGQESGTVIRLAAATPTMSAFTSQGTTSTATTSATTLAFATRDSTITDSIAFTSAVGFAVGDLVLLNSGVELTYSNNFIQLDTIRSINGSTVTFASPIVIPIVPGLASHALTKIVPVSGVVIKGFQIDCTGNGFARNNASIAIFGVNLGYARDSVIENLQFTGCSGGGAMIASYGYHNIFRRLNSVGGGEGGYFDLALSVQTEATASDWISEQSFGFAIGVDLTVSSQLSNITANAPGARAFKVSNAAWNNFVNIRAINSRGGTGLVLNGGSYRNQFRNVTVLDSKNNDGLVTFSNDNEYNGFDGVVAYGNGFTSPRDLIINTFDHDNTFRNVAAGVTVDLGTSNTIGTTLGYRAKVSNSAVQSINSAALTDLTYDTESWDVGALHSIASNTGRFTVPSGVDGPFEMCVNASFAASATGVREARWTKNGTAIPGSTVIIPATAAGTTNIMACVTDNLAAGDFVVSQALQSSGGALDVTAIATVRRMN